VGAWASVLKLRCYIPSAPTDTHAPHVQGVQLRAHCCASKIMCTFVNEPCVRVKCYFKDRFRSIRAGVRAHAASVLAVSVLPGANRFDRTKGSRSDLQARQQNTKSSRTRPCTSLRVVERSRDPSPVGLTTQRRYPLQSGPKPEPPMDSRKTAPRRVIEKPQGCRSPCSPIAARRNRAFCASALVESAE
jgi:hypothetical protein